MSSGSSSKGTSFHCSVCKKQHAFPWRIGNDVSERNAKLRTNAKMRLCLGQNASVKYPLLPNLSMAEIDILAKENQTKAASLAPRGPRGAYGPQRNPSGPRGPRGRTTPCDPYDIDLGNWYVWEAEKWTEIEFDKVRQIYKVPHGDWNVLVQLAQPKMDCWEKPGANCESFRLLIKSMKLTFGQSFSRVRSIHVCNLCTLPGNGMKDLALLTEEDFPHLRKIFFSGIETQRQRTIALLNSGFFNMYIQASGTLAFTGLDYYWAPPRSMHNFEARERWYNAQYECAQTSIDLRIPVFRRGQCSLKSSGFTHPSMKYNPPPLEIVTSRALAEDFTSYVEQRLTASIPFDIFQLLS